MNALLATEASLKSWMGRAKRRYSGWFKPEDLEDLLQDVLLAAIRRQGTPFVDERWLWVALSLEARERYRKVRRRERLSFGFERGAPEVEADQEARAALTEFLQKLPTSERRAVKHYLFSAASLEQAALRDGMSRSTLARRVTDLRTRLGVSRVRAAGVAV